MKKRKRKIRIRALICLIAIFMTVIAAIWFIINKVNEPDASLTILLKNETITISQGSEFDIEQYVTAVKDNEGNLLSFAETKHMPGTYWLNENIDTDLPGTYEVTISALDRKHQTAEQSITVTVEAKAADNNHSDNENPDHTTSTTDSGGYDPTIDPYQCEPYYVKGILLVNKHHPLPPDYGELDLQASQALEQLQAAALEAGYDIPTLSAYRSYEYQGTLYNSYVERDGQEAADTYSARAGFSEHQSGLAFDVGELDNAYGETSAGKWLYAHCHEFGFILRYPQGKESITGYMYEPWHIRYVGKDIATDIYEKKVTLEEYLGVY